MKKKKSIQLINLIRSLIIKKNLLQTNETLILAISGGQDSIFLLVVFFIIKKQWNFKLKVLYCNHLWQQDTFYIYLHLSKILFCFQIQLSFFITLKFLPSEEKSRYWRSKSFYRLLEFTLSSKLLTGHTLTDQIETFLFNIIRGSSFKGTSSLKLEKKFTNFSKNNFFNSNKDFILFKVSKNNIFLQKKQNKNIFLRGLNKKNSITSKLECSFFFKKEFLILKKNSFEIFTVRPLLLKTRVQIKTLCTNWKLPLFPDQSNQQTKYTRNRLRKQILPTFRFFFNPKVDLVLSRYNEILNEEEQYIENLIFKLFYSIINEDKNAYFLNVSLFASLSLSFQRRICFLFIQKKLLINLNFSIIDNLISIMNEYWLVLKRKKSFNKKNPNFYCFFFPELGTIYFSESVLIIFK